MHIELLKTSDAGYTVIVDGLFCDLLAPDEALGVVAAAIFAGVKRVPYVRSYAEWDRWERKYHTRPEDQRPPLAGLLTWNGSPRHHQHMKVTP